MKWHKVYRSSGLIEYICDEHGCGHPTEESAALVAEYFGDSTETWMTHGCCGCCSRDDFPGATSEA